MSHQSTLVEYRRRVVANCLCGIAASLAIPMVIFPLCWMVLLGGNYGLVMAILVAGVSFEHSAWLVSTTLLNDYAHVPVRIGNSPRQLQIAVQIESVFFVFVLLLLLVVYATISSNSKDPPSTFLLVVAGVVISVYTISRCFCVLYLGRFIDGCLHITGRMTHIGRNTARFTMVMGVYVAAITIVLASTVYMANETETQDFVFAVIGVLMPIFAVVCLWTAVLLLWVAGCLRWSRHIIAGAV